MTTTIKIKSSTVANKVPDASALQVAELAVNLVDQKLYTKDASDQVFEIGKGGNVPGGGSPPASGDDIGDLFFDTTKNQLLYWDGTKWVPINAELALGDLSDVEVSGAGFLPGWPNFPCLGSSAGVIPRCQQSLNIFENWGRSG